MKLYKSYYILAISVWFFGNTAFADYCCPDKVRCRIKEGPDWPKEMGVLYGGALQKYEWFLSYSGCYPTDLANGEDFSLSIKACSEQVPGCTGDKCYVGKGDNQCPNSGGDTPLKPPHNTCEAYEQACINEGCAGLQKMPNVRPNVIKDCNDGVYDAKSQNYENCRNFIKSYVQTGYMQCDNPPWWMK